MRRHKEVMASSGLTFWSMSASQYVSSSSPLFLAVAAVSTAQDPKSESRSQWERTSIEPTGPLPWYALASCL